MVAMFQHIGYTRAPGDTNCNTAAFGKKIMICGCLIISCVVFHLGVCANHLLKEIKFTLCRFEVMSVCMFTAGFSSVFNVLTSNDYTVQITGKVAESAKLAFAVVS